MTRRTPNEGLVYSSEQGRICPNCGKPTAECRCRGAKRAGSEPRQGPGFPKDGVVRVSRETKGRKGKGVTLISGLPLDAEALEQLVKRLKKSCGSGGTVKEGRVEIQGDHRDAIVAILQADGFTVKRAGG